MSKQNNYLKSIRKKSPLVQSDVAFLVGISGKSSISRFEKGQKAPNMLCLISYRLLFDCPIELLYEPLFVGTKAIFINRVRQLIIKLEEDDHQKNSRSIHFLKLVIIRLTSDDI